MFSVFFYFHFNPTNWTLLSTHVLSAINVPETMCLCRMYRTPSYAIAGCSFETYNSAQSDQMARHAFRVGPSSVLQSCDSIQVGPKVTIDASRLLLFPLLCH